MPRSVPPAPLPLQNSTTPTPVKSQLLHLGQKLCWIAEYVEGYPAAVQPERQETSWGWQITGGMRREVYQVASVVYGSALDQKTWSFPKGCQHTGVGGLLHAALLQFYREHLPHQLISVAAAAKEIGIGRQTLHEWMSTEGILWIYEAERDVIWLDRREVRRLWRKKHGLQNAEPDIEGPCCPPREPNTSQTGSTPSRAGATHSGAIGSVCFSSEAPKPGDRHSHVG
ncbi:hypothetical protein KSC_105220 [Ktedonobacter sp. SOSP1-52]|uniref:hypothetical protein n=1 Tax=Ktedonobacter sp. SOSP1-52 TaxID=2778366 RepID=UPI001914EE95|nr:hypothetical protein [Ktedonobacter sp. SOSP1-52]GHO71630.1 hypothetical protein KSC_105220 [Ktedonobacter sp. SOSP1-52]